MLSPNAFFQSARLVHFKGFSRNLSSPKRAAHSSFHRIISNNSIQAAVASPALCSHSPATSARAGIDISFPFVCRKLEKTCSLGRALEQALTPHSRPLWDSKPNIKTAVYDTFAGARYYTRVAKAGICATLTSETACKLLFCETTNHTGGPHGPHLTTKLTSSFPPSSCCPPFSPR